MLSVIIPAYNEENYIGRCLQSLSQQSYRDFETIVVCNGCTDRTCEIARNLGSKVIEIQEKGIVLARNVGANEALGETLLFLDADTHFHENDALERMMSFGIDQGTFFALPNHFRLKYRLYLVFRNILVRLGGINGALFCKKSYFDMVGGFSESSHPTENRNLLRRLNRFGKFGVVDAYVVTSMRRYECRGFFSVAVYWLRILLFGKKKNPYEDVR